MPIINDSNNNTIFLGESPVVEVRLGGQLLWPSDPISGGVGGNEPIDIIEVTLPELNIKSIPNTKLPSFKKKDLDLLDKISSGGFAFDNLDNFSLPAIALPALPMLSGIEIPCDGNTLPTRADIVNEFNKLAQMPSKLQVWIDGLPDIEEKLKAEKTLLEEKVKSKQAELESSAENIEGEIEDTIISEIESEFGDVIEQIQGIIDQIEEVMDLIADILSPYWKKGKVRNWQKEADDAWNELIQEYHIYIPTKMLEMISKIIPINFEVPILGIQINVLKILESEEQERIVAELSGMTEEYTAKSEQLKADFESGKLEQDAYDSAMGMLGEEKSAIIDKFFSLMPEEYQHYNGQWGVKCDEWKAKLTWQYIKTEIVKWCTNALFSAFDALIGKFKEIWDALGLPDLPIPLGFDVEAFIKAIIDEAKQQAIQYKDDLIAEGEKIVGEIDQIKKDIENAPERLAKEIENAPEKIEQEIEEFKKDLENKAEEIKKEIEEFDIEEAAFNFLIEKLEDVQLFGMSLLDVIGGDIEETVKMAEKDIDNLIKAARDFAANWQKELLNVWIKKIKKFLDAIGLGKLLDLLTLTLCDVLPLIGIPTSFDVELPV